MFGNYEQAETILKKNMEGEEAGSKSYSLGTYQLFLLYTMQNSSQADSLLNQLVIFAPEKETTTDAIYLNLFVKDLQEDTRKGFYSNSANKSTYRDSLAVIQL